MTMTKKSVQISSHLKKQFEPYSFRVRREAARKDDNYYIAWQDGPSVPSVLEDVRTTFFASAIVNPTGDPVGDVVRLHDERTYTRDFLHSLLIKICNRYSVAVPPLEAITIDRRGVSIPSATDIVAEGLTLQQLVNYTAKTTAAKS
jgi:hypothetical protein